MADSKITALTSIGTSTDPVLDQMVIVDVSDGSMAATGTTKKVSLNQLLATSPTATLASATITGDLTVDTSTLKVDSTNNRVGINTASPILPLDVRGAAGAGALFLKTTDPTAPVASAYIQTPVSTGFSSTVPMYGFWYQNCGMGNPASENLSWIINSSEAMRLNSTGLGVGRSPSYRFQASSGTKATTASIATVGGITTTDTDDFGIFFRIKTDATAANRYTAISSFENGSGNGPRDLVLQDLGGNVGIGVTPSAWGTGYTAIQNRQTCWFSTSARDANFGANIYVDAVGYKYIAAAQASLYTQYQGAHTWYTAAAGAAANDPITTFASAKMTLDASGNLILLSSNTPATLATNGQLTVNATSNTNLRFSYRGSDGTTRVANITLA